MAMLLVSSLFLSTMPGVHADTVVRAESYDMLPSGDFTDADAWELTTRNGYLDEDAPNTDASIADGALTFSHAREKNLEETTKWAIDSITDSNASKGAPDDAYTWSKGPNITLDNFDFSGQSTYDIHNVSIVLAFAVPETLQQDSVRIIVQTGNRHLLVRTFSHTFAPIDHMNNNPLHIDIDGEGPWDWAALMDLQVVVDYVSVGEFDDSEVRVDAVGVWVRHGAPSSGFETAKAEQNLVAEHSPVMAVDLMSGSTDLMLSGCGFEATDGTGTWTSAVMQVPAFQTWGRFHPSVDGNATWKAMSSDDGEVWETLTVLEDGPLPPAEYLQLEATLFDGCLEALTLSVNDPTLTVRGEIIGAPTDLLPQLSEMRIGMNGALLDNFTLTEGQFESSAYIGHLLPETGGEIDVGVSARFQWSGMGEAQNMVVRIDAIELVGGFVIEWDRDPSCEGIEDQSLDEDGGGLLIPLRSTCTDDITAITALSVTATSSDESIIVADVVDGDVRVQPVLDQSGTVTIDVLVTDERGNQWTDVFTVTVAAVNDAPVLDPLPLDLSIEVGASTAVPLSYGDVDTPDAALMVTTNHAWALIHAGVLTLSPDVAGDHEIIVTLSDGEHEVSRTIRLVATAFADLMVESVEIKDSVTGETAIVDGSAVQVDVFVRNAGRATAQPVTLRCTANGEFVATATIPVLTAGAIDKATCDWMVTTGGAADVVLGVQVDRDQRIDETNEANNNWTTELHVDAYTPPSADPGISAGGGISPIGLWAGVGLLVVLGVALLQFGPGRIRRIN